MNRTKTHEDYIGITPVPYFKLRQVKFQRIAISKAVLKCSIKFISSKFKYSFLSTDHTNLICYTIMKNISFFLQRNQQVVNFLLFHFFRRFIKLNMTTMSTTYFYIQLTKMTCHFLFKVVSKVKISGNYFTNIILQKGVLQFFSFMITMLHNCYLLHKFL